MNLELDLYSDLDSDKDLKLLDSGFRLRFAIGLGLQLGIGLGFVFGLGLKLGLALGLGQHLKFALELQDFKFLEDLDSPSDQHLDWPRRSDLATAASTLRSSLLFCFLFCFVLINDEQRAISAGDPLLMASRLFLATELASLSLSLSLSLSTSLWLTTISFLKG